MRIISDIIWVYIVILVLRVLSSYFPINPWSRSARYVRWLHQATDPVLVPVRRIIPPIRVGNGGLDLSPTIVIFILIVIANIL